MSEIPCTSPIVHEANRPEGSNPFLTALAKNADSNTFLTKTLPDGSLAVKIGRWETIIDPEDLPKMSGRSWSSFRRANTRYCWSFKPDKVRLHALIIGDKPGLTIDHINRNGLDNRKCNLRHVTQSDNIRNQAPRSSSGFKGVYRFRKGWEAQITVNGRLRHLGLFATAPEAAGAVEQAERHLEECEHRYTEVLSGVQCVVCGHFVGNWE
jgi:hypothetical protein